MSRECRFGNGLDPLAWVTLPRKGVQPFEDRRTEQESSNIQAARAGAVACRGNGELTLNTDSLVSFQLHG